MNVLSAVLNIRANLIQVSFQFAMNSLISCSIFHWIDHVFRINLVRAVSNVANDTIQTFVQPVTYRVLCMAYSAAGGGFISTNSAICQSVQLGGRRLEQFTSLITESTYAVIE